jgi:hypothetical protein
MLVITARRLMWLAMLILMLAHYTAPPCDAPLRSGVSLIGAHNILKRSV